MNPAIVRTIVPYVVGLAVTLAARWGINLEPSAELTGALTVVIGAVYYVAVRLLAKRWPVLERLLGSRQAFGSQLPAARLTSSSKSLRRSTDSSDSSTLSSGQANPSAPTDGRKANRTPSLMAS
jgi:hypothetical protein